MQLRPYQQEGKDDIYAAWGRGVKHVLEVLPTGAGKTVLFSEVLREHSGASVAIAHRQELVTQISTALNRDQVPHRILAPDDVVRLAVKLHMEDTGRSYQTPNGRCTVAGVDTLLARKGTLSHWLPTVTKWVQDEAHHLLRANKWGKAADLFPNAIGLGVTATPVRADGKGLGIDADGLFEEMIVGPNMRDLINAGYLTDYRIVAPPSDFDRSTTAVGKDGDFTRPGMKAAVRESSVIGDVVTHYLKFAPGKLGVTFATDVETATDIAREFNAAGVPAAVVSAKTPNAERAALLRKFKNRELMQLVNVDLFGEGFDLPAIEVVSMARPTQSYALFVQQFGRALRLMISPVIAAAWDTYTDAQRRQFIADSKKPHAIIIDHVNNINTELGGHGLPDAPKHWTLDRRDKQSRQKPSDAIPTRNCLNPECWRPYERIYKACHYCGLVFVPPVGVGRSGPEFVDGDLTEIDAATLALMRGEVAKIDKPVSQYAAELIAARVPTIGQRGHVNKHKAKQDAQSGLRESIAYWAGWQRAQDRPDSESYRRFYFKFGIDVLSAQALGTSEATALRARIDGQMEGVERCG